MQKTKQNKTNPSTSTLLASSLILCFSSPAVHIMMSGKGSLCWRPRSDTTGSGPACHSVSHSRLMGTRAPFPRMSFLIQILGNYGWEKVLFFPSIWMSNNLRLSSNYHYLYITMVSLGNLPNRGRHPPGTYSSQRIPTIGLSNTRWEGRRAVLMRNCWLGPWSALR